MLLSRARGFCVINLWFIGLRICNNFPFLLVQMITDDLWHVVSYVYLQNMQSLYIFFETKTEKREVDLFLRNMIQVCSHLVLSINVKSRRQMVLFGNYYKTIVWYYKLSLSLKLIYEISLHFAILSCNYGQCLPDLDIIYLI